MKKNMTDETPKNPDAEPVVIQASDLEEKPTPDSSEDTTVNSEPDEVDNLNEALAWQKDFAERSEKASAEIRVVLSTYEIDMVAETKILELNLEIPISFRDLKEHSAAQPISATQLKNNYRVIKNKQNKNG